TLAKRLLFPALPSNALPPLLSSPNAPKELNDELYDFISLALRAYVSPWWHRISRFDKEFLPDITRILTFVVRTFEARLLSADYNVLLLRDIPLIVTQHYRDFRDASAKVGTIYGGAGALSLPQLFHQLQPHLAIAPTGELDAEYFRQTIDIVLKHCLPPEDYASEAERVIVREIMLKVVMQDVLPLVSEPWFIERTILNLLHFPEQQSPKTIDVAPASLQTPHFSFHTLLVTCLSAIQTVSGACLSLANAYRRAVQTVRTVNGKNADISPRPAAQLPPSLEALESTPSGAVPSLANRSSQASTSTPSRSLSASSKSSNGAAFSSLSDLPPSPTDNSTHPNGNSVNAVILAEEEDCARPLLDMLTEIFTIRHRLAASCVVTTASLVLASCASFIDRLLPHLLRTWLSPNFVLDMVRIGKRTLFPNGFPQPAPPMPTLEEQAAVRARLTEWKPSTASGHAALEPLENRECNVHLLVITLERILLELFPELLG
ncbi:hypothetical protein FISHEDRAFT_29852, partial [Fistulina hepatica ATCC 64428]